MKQNQIPSLWPEEAVRTDVITPAAILRQQALALEEATDGLLIGEVSDSEIDEQTIEHHLDIIAPFWATTRHRILSLSHDKDLIYPVKLSGFGLPKIYYTSRPKDSPVSLVDQMRLSAGLKDFGVKHEVSSAFNQPELLDLIKHSFRARKTQSLIVSLIAKSNEIEHDPFQDADFIDIDDRSDTKVSPEIT